jgi:outer membrane protein assembly factor BamB
VTFKENSYALKFGKGPFSTPLVADGLVYTLGVTGEVVALDADKGSVVWHESFAGDLTGDRLLNCGNTVSPLLFENRLITHVGDETHGRMTAYHPKTGKKIWTWEEDIAGYASPIAAIFDGKQQIVSMTQNKIVGIDPANGKLLWSHPYKVEWRENIITPVVHGNGIIVSGREQGATIKLDILRNGNTWRVEPVWSNQEQVMYMSSPVLASNRLYGFSHKNKGQLFMLDATTGKTLATGPGRKGENAQLVRTEKHLLALFTSGELTVFPLNNTSLEEPIKTYQVSETPTWPHPILIKTKVLIKNNLFLSSWKLHK